MSTSTPAPPPATTNDNDEAMLYALGALRLRKRGNRRKTITGELIWTDLADVSLTLGLITWTSDRSQRVRTKRIAFLQEFLSSRGVIKTRKQISSRLQVLKTEWRDTSYSALLENPDHYDNPNRDIGVADGSRQEPIASDEMPGLDLQRTEPVSQGSSSVSPNSLSYVPDSQCPMTIVNDYYTLPHQPTGPSSSQSSIDIGSDQYVQGPIAYTSAVSQTAFDNSIDGYYMPFESFEYS